MRLAGEPIHVQVIEGIHHAATLGPVGDHDVRSAVRWWLRGVELGLEVDEAPDVIAHRVSKLTGHPVDQVLDVVVELEGRAAA